MSSEFRLQPSYSIQSSVQSETTTTEATKLLETNKTAATIIGSHRATTLVTSIMAPPLLPPPPPLPPPLTTKESHISSAISGGERLRLIRDNRWFHSLPPFYSSSSCSSSSSISDRFTKSLTSTLLISTSSASLYSSISTVVLLLILLTITIVVQPLLRIMHRRLATMIMLTIVTNLHLFFFSFLSTVFISILQSSLCYITKSSIVSSFFSTLCWLTRSSSSLSFCSSSSSVVHLGSKVSDVGGECDPHHYHRAQQQQQQQQQSKLSLRPSQQSQRTRHGLSNHRHYRSRCHHPFLPSCLTFLCSLPSTLMSIGSSSSSSSSSSTSSSTATTSTTSSISASSCQQPLFTFTSFSTFSHSFPLQLIILVLITTFASKVCCSSSNNNADSSNKIVATSGNSYAISTTTNNDNLRNPYIEEEFLCGDIDIRNSVKQFSQLENCTVVEGYVKIVLIDNGIPEHYENLSFPKLREITDYLLLFRAFGMQSMAKLFPNLAVIRGRKLMHDYAFVVYEMYNLQEIGLHSLTHVLRGDIRIEKNPNLCFIDTIDWSRIAKNYQISVNKDTERCPNCPNHCPIVGVKRKSDGMVFGDMNGRACWTSDVCQKRICPDECERRNATCTDSGECCSDQCMGGCTILSHKPVLNQTCVACKNFVYNHRCYKNCPPNTYEYFGRRCITAEECHNLSVPDLKNPVFYKAFNGKCASSCPVGYGEDPTNKTHCLHCGDTCPKECLGVQVSNIASAQRLKDCTLIKGNLEIYLSSGGAQIVKELEENLKDIKEITGYLKIARSFPIITLDFLRNLEVIGGESLERNSSFIVLDNPNLQDLWTFDNNTQQQQLKTGKKRIQILKGRIFFHVNPKLCYQKIKKMTEYVNIVKMNNTWELSDVSSSTNGDRVTCDVHKLNVTFFGVVSNVVGVNVENFKPKMKDARHLLAYLIYFRETENYNVTIFEGRDACSDNGWNVIDFDAPEFDSTNYSNYVLTIIPNLKPYTLYALYVKTYIIAPDEIGGQSDILYFKTLPSTSSQPRNLVAKAIKHNEISVSWDLPARPNGEVDYYKIRATRDKVAIIDRDYCHLSYFRDNRIKSQVTPPQSNSLANPNNKSDTGGSDGSKNQSTKSGSNSSDLPTNTKPCCSCKADKFRPTEAEQSINFENSLLDIVYIKRDDETPPNNSSYDKNTLPSNARRRRNILEAEAEEEVLFERESNITNTTTIGPFVRPSTTTMTTTPSGGAVSSVLSMMNDDNDNDNDNNNNSESHNDSIIMGQEDKWQLTKIVDSLNDTLTDLHHYTEYTIEVRACQNANIPKPCSETAITYIRTLPLATADNIDEQTISYSFDNRTTESKYKLVYINWAEPVDPNGFILSYQIKYKQITSEPKKQPDPVLCISRKDFANNSYSFTLELLPGNYSVKIRARSLANFGSWTQPFYFVIEEPGLGHIYLSIGFVFVSVLLLLVLVGFLFRLKLNRSKLDYVSVNPDYMSAGLAYEPDPKWEVSRDKISLVCELGQGSFGMVYEGELASSKEVIRCAIKTVNDGATIRERIDFLKEADIMKSFTDCNHVVKLLGIVSTSQPVYVLMEIMPKGDLRKYLRDNRPNNEENPFAQPPTILQLYKMAIEISDGMAYLASKKFVHRDLAARNCMVADDLTVKIGDFGMTRDICETDYYRKGGKGLLPVRWMSPESLKDGIFTTYSDVWSFGVVLWEMCTLASQPYQGLSNEEVLKFVIDGGHMSEPEDCPSVLWNLIIQCWQRKPKLRPNFIKIIEQLLNHVEDRQSFLPISYYYRWKMEPPSESAEAAISAVHEDTAADTSVPLNNQSNSDNESEYHSDSGESDDDQLDQDDMDVQFFPLGRLGGSLKIFVDEENTADTNVDVENPNGAAAPVTTPTPSTSNSNYLLNSPSVVNVVDNQQLLNSHPPTMNGNDESVANRYTNHHNLQQLNHHQKPQHPSSPREDNNNSYSNNNLMFNNKSPIGSGRSDSKSASLVSTSSSFSSRGSSASVKNGMIGDHHLHHNHHAVFDDDDDVDMEEDEEEEQHENKGLLGYSAIAELKSVAAASLNKANPTGIATVPTATAAATTTPTTTTTNVPNNNNNKNRNNNSLINGHLMNTSIV